MKLRLFYIIFIFCFVGHSLFAVNKEDDGDSSKTSSHIEEYIRFIHAFEDHLGPVGDYTKGEIQIVLEPKKIKEIEELHKQKLIRRGVEEKDAISWSRVGIIDSDSIWIWIRDAVVMPSGRKTIRDRMSWKTAVDGPQGVSTLPVLKDKRIIVCLKYKHATRAWQIEVPRGIRLFGETVESAARRQLSLKTGLVTSKQLYLGNIAPDSSSFSTLTPVFLSYIDEKAEVGKLVDDNVIGILALTKQELKEGFLKGYLELVIHEETKKVAVNDSYLSYALLQAEIRNLI